jgi:hypothetical protein
MRRAREEPQLAGYDNPCRTLPTARPALPAADGGGLQSNLDRKLSMSEKKQRNEIPAQVAAEVLFRANRICCVCRTPGKGVQIHHIDDNPGNSEEGNLAVLCFDCHRDTQVRGGFDRKLNTLQVKLYKSDWLSRVEANRSAEQVPIQIRPSPKGQILRYEQVIERSEEFSFDFEADYFFVGTSDPTADSETNACINVFVTRLLQGFRVESRSRKSAVDEIKSDMGFGMGTNSLVLSPFVSLFTPDVLSLEFNISYYYAGAAHPNTSTKTLNFGLKPSFQMELYDMVQPYAGGLEVISNYCIKDLHKQQAQRWADPIAREAELKGQFDDWILKGAGARRENYERISIRKNGFAIHFDPYCVGSYAEGKYEVFVPAHELRYVLQDTFAQLIKWW